MMRFAFYPIRRAFTSIAMGMAIVLIVQTAQAVTETSKPMPGQVVGFENAQGKALFLHDFKGKPVIINMWATWCAPCIAEMPSLAQLQKDYAGRGLSVLALSEDDSIALPIAFYNKQNIVSLIPYLDSGHAVWRAVEARGVPTTLLINKNGDIIKRIEGPVDWHAPTVRQIVETIMN